MWRSTSNIAGTKEGQSRSDRQARLAQSYAAQRLIPTFWARGLRLNHESALMTAAEKGQLINISST